MWLAMTDSREYDDDLLRTQARDNPSAPALTLPGRIVSFAEYADRTSQIGHQLLDRVGGRQRVIIVLLSDRSDTALVH